MILIGPPGVGKGTQSALLEQRLGAKPVSSGMIFRAEIEAQTDLGELAKSYIDRGELVPNGVTIQMIVKRLRSDEIRKRGFILDGFPRTIRQAEALSTELDQLGVSLDAVISLEVPDSQVVARLSGRMGCTRCGEIYHSMNKPPKRPGFCDKCDNPLFVREDDREETINERLRVFHETTAPVIGYYETHHSLIRIDANRASEEVYQDILKALKQ